MLIHWTLNQKRQANEAERRGELGVIFNLEYGRKYEERIWAEGINDEWGVAFSEDGARTLAWVAFHMFLDEYEFKLGFYSDLK